MLSLHRLLDSRSYMLKILSRLLDVREQQSDNTRSVLSASEVEVRRHKPVELGDE